MRTYGVPSEVLTDNSKQFTGRVRETEAGEGAVRVSLPRARHHREAHRAVLADHREGGAATPDVAPRVP
jgi:hypothetical protein